MSLRNKHHDHELPSLLSNYAISRSLDFHQYSPYHMRIMDSGYTTIDIWTSGRYYVLNTDYHALSDLKIVERGGEKGQLPATRTEILTEWLDKLFYAADMEEIQ